jgi:alanine racemase
LTKASKVAKKLNKKAILHIEVETGMNRTGFEKKQKLTRSSLSLKKEREHILFKGLCTHYAGAESITNYYKSTSKSNVLKMLSPL